MGLVLLFALSKTAGDAAARERAAVPGLQFGDAPAVAFRGPRRAAFGDLGFLCDTWSREDAIDATGAVAALARDA